MRVPILRQSCSYQNLFFFFSHHYLLFAKQFIALKLAYLQGLVSLNIFIYTLGINNSFPVNGLLSGLYLFEIWKSSLINKPLTYLSYINNISWEFIHLYCLSKNYLSLNCIPHLLKGLSQEKYWLEFAISGIKFLLTYFTRCEITG